MDNKYELVLCVVNAGFSQNVMEAARAAGAKGGTVVRARGTANPESEEFFNITVRPDKEIVMILTKKEIKDAIMHAVYRDSCSPFPSTGRRPSRKNSGRLPLHTGRGPGAGCLVSPVLPRASREDDRGEPA